MPVPAMGWPFVVKLLVPIAGKVEGAARVGVCNCVEINPPQLTAEAHVVLAVSPKEEIDEAESLITSERRYWVVKPGEVCERNDGDAPVSRDFRDSIDPKLLHNVLLEREGVRELRALPIEAQRKIVDEVGAEVMCLAQIQLLASY